MKKILIFQIPAAILNFAGHSFAGVIWSKFWTIWMLDTLDIEPLTIFLLFHILTAILNFGGNKKCLVYEWPNFLYVRLHHILTRDVLRQSDAILFVSRTLDVKTTQRKSCAVNVLQVLDLIFEPCFKVQFGHLMEEACFLPYYWSLGFEPFLVDTPPQFLLIYLTGEKHHVSGHVINDTVYLPSEYNLTVKPYCAP